MTSIKKTFFLFLGFILFGSVGLLTLELIFGNWFNQDGWGKASQLNLIRNKQFEYFIDHSDDDTPVKTTYTRDKYGLRGSCKEPKMIDVLSLGGSTTDQRYIEDGATFQDHIENYLSSKYKKIFCVSNAGVDGHSTFGHLESFKRWFPLIPDLQPKIFILYIGINDAGFRVQSNNFDLADQGKLKNLIKQRSALYDLYKKMQNIYNLLTEQRAYAQHSAGVPKIKDYTEKSSSLLTKDLIKINTNAFANRLSMIITEISKYNAKFICISQPHLFTKNINGNLAGIADVFEFEGKSYNGLDFYHSLDSINNQMEKQCKEAGGGYLNLTQATFEIEDFYDPIHMTPEGVKKIGLYMAEAINQIKPEF
tara:strand:- start:143 stop:1237 length:1095 start_codon:yes stop_codon:yes gene_type:complete